jgi:hypothetical protein
MSSRLEPGPEQGDMRRTADAIGAFNDNEFAAVVFVFDAG